MLFELLHVHCMILHIKSFSLLTNWRASEASETLSEVYKFELVRICVYIYMYGGMYAIK